MANYELITFDTTNERRQREDSEDLTMDFTAVRVGASNLTISESGASFSFGDNPIIDVTSIEIGASGLKISESSGNISVNSNKVVDVALPTTGTDAANKAYVDSVATGLDFKGSCTVVATSALNAVTAAGSGVGKTLTADANGLLTIDGVSTWVDMDNNSGVNDPHPVTGTPASRVLVDGQANAVDNGIYAVKNKGAAGTPFVLIRATDFDENDEVTPGAFTFIEQGTSNADTGWVLASDGDLEIDVSNLDFVQFTGGATYTGGDGIDVSGVVISVDLATASGLEFSSGELQVDLAAAGSGTGGLVLTGNEIEVNAGDSIALTSGGIAVEAYTGSGTTSRSNSIDVTASGIRIMVDASTIEGSNQGGAGSESLRVKDAGITETQLHSSVAGDGLSGGNGTPLSVNVGDGLEIESDNVQVDWSDALTNNQGASMTIRQVAYIAADGQAKLAQANVTDLDQFELVVVDDASIADQASGEYVMRRGAIITGYSGLTPGKRQYVNRSTAGAMTEALTGFASGEFVYSVGRAKSATELIYDPQFEFVF